MSDRQNQFIRALLEFNSDDELRVRQPGKRSAAALRLAAAGRETEVLETTRTLTNPDGQVLVRIFKNESRQCYDLFFIAEDDRFSRYPLLFEPDSFKYFVIHRDGHAEIPFRSSLDPGKGKLSLTYPIQGSYQRIPAGNTDPTDEGLGRRGKRLWATFPPAITKALFVFTVDSGSEITRLVPVRDGEAAVSIPEGAAKEVWISGF